MKLRDQYKAACKVRRLAPCTIQTYRRWVDEFLEFFVEDDRVAQDAALLLDRLVRQGRAFGIHVLLGSQTLAGAYSLARSTIGQMAVRITLACSETDAHLILGEDNTAARLLSRPGEAIYNDAGGLVEANHPFQVAWLPDAKREQYLRAIQDRARATGKQTAPPIVFEGNVPADLESNAALHRLLSDGVTRGASAAPLAWLGEPVSIKELNRALFHDEQQGTLEKFRPYRVPNDAWLAWAAQRLCSR